VKLFLDEPGSEDARRAVDEAGVLASSILAYVECGAAFARAHRERRATGRQLPRMLEALERAWRDMAVVEFDTRIARGAVELLGRYPLRASDAIHLTSALTVATEAGVTFACFDRRLWDAAGALGLDRVPARL
jgi:predicted nucleic acid-binding protein